MPRIILILLLIALPGYGAVFFRIVEETPSQSIIEWTAPSVEWKTISEADGQYVVPVVGNLPSLSIGGAYTLPFDVFTLSLPGDGFSVSVLDSVFSVSSVPQLKIPYPGGDRSSEDGKSISDDFRFFNSAFRIESAKSRSTSLLRIQVNPITVDLDRNVRILRYARFAVVREPLQTLRKATAQSNFSGALPACKLYLVEEGVYRVTGQDLADAGLPVNEIDPRLLCLENRGESVPFYFYGGEDGRFDSSDQLIFYGERLRGEGNEYYHAWSDTNVYWLRWDRAGATYTRIASSADGKDCTDFMDTRHFEKDLAYYNGDSSSEIQETMGVAGEGWVWDSAIDPGEVFSTLFDLPGCLPDADSARLTFRLRGETGDIYPNSHHVRVRINRRIVFDGFFDDRQELIGGAPLPKGLLKEQGNQLEIESLRENPNVNSRFYFDWFDVAYRRSMTAENGFLRLSGVAQEAPLHCWVQGFSSNDIFVLAPSRRLWIEPFATGRQWPATLVVESAGLADGNYSRFYINGKLLYSGTRGIAVLVVDHRSGQVKAAKSFDTYGSAAESDSLAAFVNSQPDSAVIMAGVCDDGATSLRPPAIAAFQALGSRLIANLQYRDSWAFIAQKGAAGEPAEQLVAQGAGGVRLSRSWIFTGGAAHSARFSVPPNAGDTLIVFDRTAARAPLRLKPVLKSGLDSYSGADYLIVTSKKFLDQAERLRRYREAHNGFTVFIADIEEIYDRFNYGIPDAEALRSFLKFAYENGLPRPSFALFLGDASWDPKKNLPNSKFNNEVPSLGNPVSDVLLGCFDGPADILAELSIGRLPVNEPFEAEQVIDKIIEYEAAPSAAWKKQFLFISGGADASEQRQFESQSQALAKDFVAPQPVSGRPLFISKKEENPQIDYRTQILDAVDKGAVWINFIGHAASRTWELMFNTPDIDDLQNKGRYPVISSMTCHTGRFAEPSQQSFSEHFLLARDKGAVGFWGTTGWGYAYEDYLYLRQLYPIFASDSLRYLGKIFNEAQKRLWQTYGSFGHFRHLILQYNLLGDPAMQLALPTLPDLALSSENVLMQPFPAGEADSSATVKVMVENWGLFCRDSSTVRFTFRHLPTGKEITAAQRIGPVALAEWAEIPLPLRGLAGVVEAAVTVDAMNEILESDERNNEQGASFTILSSDLQLIAPPQNAWVPLQGLTLKAQAPQRQYNESLSYTFEIDTVRTFDSPLRLVSPPIRAHPLLLRWTPTGLRPAQRYFWRVKPIQTQTLHEPFIASFTTHEAESFGWLHHGDFDATCRFEDTDKRGKGVSLAEREILLLLQSSRTEQVGYALLEVDRRSVLTTGRGHNVAIVDPISGTVKASAVFDTYGNPQAPQNLAQFIRSAQPGDYVLAAVSEEGGLNLNEDVYTAYESIGSALCRQIGFRYAWAIIGRKGAAVGSAPEGLQPPGGEAVILKDSLLVFAQKGSIVSARIGPAKGWKSALFEGTAPSGTAMTCRVIGQAIDGSEALLWEGSLGNVDLGFIDPHEYPYLVLSAEMALGQGKESPTLTRWGIVYDPPADLALSPHLFSISADTVMVGSTVTFFGDLYNIGLSESGSTVLEIVQKNGETRRTVSELTIPAIGIDRYFPFRQQWVADKPGRIDFILTVDPRRELIELTKGNNRLTVSLFVLADDKPPQIQLTVDDREIFDGDWVAAQPKIKARILDNNPEPLADTTAVTVTLDGKRVSFKSGELALEANGNGCCLLHYSPTLAPGEHRLEIQAVDAARNRAAATLRFVVEDQLKIRNLLIYPNPVSRDGEISFELSEPAQVAIKIFTLAGRLIGTIDAGTLGAGYHRLYWDGLDADGDRPANGVYIFKAIASREGKTT
ncbi:MAG: C25 family cysteine peptidase, partial [candidate division KSB1 bacterium]|nr:C25 family cysteine peptidase [candidate division KSB1 bacterium]